MHTVARGKGNVINPIITYSEQPAEEGTELPFICFEATRSSGERCSLTLGLDMVRVASIALLLSRLF
jgi:hypothetical protein